MSPNDRPPRSPAEPTQRRHRARLAVLVACLAMAASWASSPAHAAPPAGHVAVARVIRVVDGDTLVAVGTDSIIFRVRLHGIDAPECGMPFGPEAQRYLESLVLEKTVQLLSKGPDRHRRLVAAVTVGRQDAGLAMLGAGMAWHDERFHKSRREPAWGTYRDARKQAQVHGLGLWTEHSPTSPWRWRQAHAAPASSVACSGPTRATAPHGGTATQLPQERP